MTQVSAGPCLLWTIPNGSSAGNMLRTGVLARVLACTGDARVVLTLSEGEPVHDELS